jgi:hypothetical protein
MNIINPITITDAMIGAGTTIAEPSATETAWNAATNYTVGTVVIRTTTHRKYRNAIAGVDATLPENLPTRWQDVGPTDRYAPFDIYTNTAATTVTSLAYVLTPGYFNALALYGLTGAQYTITVKAVTEGSIIFTRTGFLSEDPAGWYEYLFTATKPKTKIIFTDIPIRPTAEVTLTITAAIGVTVAVGMIVLGDYASLSGDGLWGGTEYGASAEPVTYSYIKTEDDGTTKIVKRHSATNLRVSVSMPTEEADAVLQSVQSVLDVPVAWIATGVVGYEGLTTFGIGSSSMKYGSFGTATLDINVKGLV